jgi:hypothetical protein
VAALLLAGPSAISTALAQATGGFIEKTDSLAARPRWTPAQIRSFLPLRGTFTFPAPYNTGGIRLTNPSDCAGKDCVQPLSGASGRNINNHRGRDTMLIFLGLRGSGPTLFGYDKRTDQVRNLGPLFDASSPFASHSGEGWYFSATQPTRLYVSDGGPALLRYDVETRAFETVFDATGQFGEGIGIDQAHSSDDDTVHSALLRDSTSHRVLGCLAYREKVQRFSYYPATADGDECEVDKSGRWLLIRQRAPQADAEDDRIVDLETGAEKTLIGETAAGGPSDTGHGYLVTKDASSSLAAAVRIWDFEQGPPPGRVMYQASSAAGDLRHISHSNAQSDVELSRQFACGSTGTTPSGSHPGEVVCFRLDGSQDVLVVAQTMGDPSAPRGGAANATLSNGNLDVTGRYYLWVSTTGGRADAFMVKVPADLLMGSGSDATSPILPTTTAAAPVPAGSLNLAAASTTVTAPDPDIVVTLSPEDTFLNVNATNESTNTRLMTYTWPDHEVANAILMKFDLSAIPAGAVVTDARLQLALVEADATPDSTYTITAHKVMDRRPVIAAATGYTADGKAAWTPNTCCSGSVPLAQADISAAYDTQAIDKTPGYKAWSLTAMAQEWVADPLTNFGVLLNSDASTLRDRYRFFASMEQADTSLRPSLTVAYSSKADVTAPVISAVTASAITISGATISWTTNEPSDSQVEYGTTAAYGSLTTLNKTRVKSHAAALGGLAAGTPYHFRARSRDFAGNLAVSSDFTLTTLADLVPPAVSITAPTTGTTLAGTVTIAANASDNIGVAGVQFKVDGANAGAEDTSSPYSGAWNTTTVSNGSHTLTAVARDVAGNVTTSAGITVTVANDLTPPSVSLTTPAAGASVTGTVTVAANASDDVGVIGVQFKLGGANLGPEDTTSPYAVSWDTTTVAEGSYTLTAVARDAAGNATTSAGVTVAVAGGVVTLAPEDTFIGLDASNQSANARLMTYTWPDYRVANAILMKFDLSAIPPGAVVTDATLQLALVASDAAAENTYTVTAHKMVGRRPVITGATGYTADGVTAWTPNTCCSNNVPLAEADISAAYDTRAIDKVPGYKSWSLTAMVQEWVASPATNLGLLLNSDASTLRDRYRYFASMEDADPALRPSLRVTYSLSPDVTPPAVSITAPTTGATVTGTVTVAASASDNVAVAGVQFQLDGVNLGVEGTTAPYSVSWNTASLANGSHTLSAVARDAAGNVATSAAITVTVANDTTPPSVAITAPVGGASVSGTVTVAATASDNVGVVGVQFKLDGANLGAEGTTAPYSVSWNSTGAANGSHALTAVARDAAGNVTTSAGVTVTVANDTTAPSVTITAPVGGASVSGPITVAATASDNVAVAGVQFKLDGTNLGAEDTTSPYSVSWNTTGVANGSHTLTGVARDSAGNVKTSASVIVTVANGVPAAGIAALYPGDVGIESNSNVIFVERFDEATLATMQSRWTDVRNGPTMQFSSDVPAGSPGPHSLNIPWVGGGVSDGGHLYKQLSPGVDDTLYVRYYIKYPTSGAYNHTGVWMGGNNPPLAWPNPQAGVKPAGNDRFIAAAEQNTITTGFDHYDYWMNMHQSADGNYWGNFLLNDPSIDARPGEWTCVEHMVKLNNPTTSLNGEHAIWLNGVKVSHLGLGFPNGRWSGGIFTQDPTGSPFEGFQWRSDASLNINWIWLQNYAPSELAGVTGTMLFDHVVAARSYIGCLASATPDPTPPTVSITSPSALATVSGTITPTASASDNVGVAGVQFKLDGANLGAEDTSSPYTVSWNTTTASGGLHTLTAVARDAAGNSATSASVAVTVSNVTGSWPNEPAGFTTLNDQPWNALTGNGWSYLRRTSSKDDRILADSTAPFSPLNDLQIIFTTDMLHDTEPSVHWMSLSSVKEIYTGWWMKVSPNWSCSPAGCGKVTFLFTNGAGQVYSNLYHPSSGVGPPYRMGANTEWAPYGQKIWYPNVTTTNINPGEWHRIEFYYKWETTPGVSGDGIIRWWVDGTLNGNYVDVHYPASAGFIEFQYAPTLQNPPPAEQYMYIDHTHVSKP